MVVPEPGEQVCMPDWAAEYRELVTERGKCLLQKKALVKERNIDGAGQIQLKIEELSSRLEKFPVGELPPEKPARLIIECGLALDCQGNELLVRRPLSVDLWHSLSVEDQKKLRDGACTLHISLCYCSLPIEPMRPILQDACAVTPECVSSKLLDTVRVKVTVDRPPDDLRCDTCCQACAESCLLLARIDCFHPGMPIHPQHIHNNVRRLVGTYPYTTITGINWKHGGEYTDEEARQLLGTDHSSKGLKVQLSRPVLVSTLSRGVVDIWIVQGGRTRASDIYSLEVCLETEHHGPTADSFYIRYTGDENLDSGDKVLIIIRAAFILDECCRPLDGAHVGGLVPSTHHHESNSRNTHQQFAKCPIPPPGYGPWTSGTGYPGANFESWFYIKAQPKVSGNKTKAKER
jgi:hypothetical protein